MNSARICSCTTSWEGFIDECSKAATSSTRQILSDCQTNSIRVFHLSAETISTDCFYTWRFIYLFIYLCILGRALMFSSLTGRRASVVYTVNFPECSSISRRSWAPPHLFQKSSEQECEETFQGGFWWMWDLQVWTCSSPETCGSFWLSLFLFAVLIEVVMMQKYLILKSRTVKVS